MPQSWGRSPQIPCTPLSHCDHQALHTAVAAGAEGHSNELVWCSEQHLRSGLPMPHPIGHGLKVLTNGMCMVPQAQLCYHAGACSPAAAACPKPVPLSQDFGMQVLTHRMWRCWTSSAASLWASTWWLLPANMPTRACSRPGSSRHSPVHMMSPLLQRSQGWAMGCVQGCLGVLPPVRTSSPNPPRCPEGCHALSCQSLHGSTVKTLLLRALVPSTIHLPRGHHTPCVCISGYAGQAAKLLRQAHGAW